MVCSDEGDMGVKPHEKHVSFTKYNFMPKIVVL